MGGQLRELAESMARDMVAHEGASCVLVVCWTRAPARVPGRAHVPYAIAMTCQSKEGVGCCAAYALSRTLDEPEKRRLEALFADATFLWRD